MSPQTVYAIGLAVVAVILIAVAVWLLLRANRKTTVVRSDSARTDVLDEGAARAARNQALIDAPRSIELNTGAASASANAGATAAAGEAADAEAGVSVPPTVGDPVPQPAAPEPAPAPAPAPEPAPAPAPAPAAKGDADDLRQIKGVGPKLVSVLAEQGITRFDQIAAWTAADIARVDANLGRFKGRIERDQWVEQARFLANGDAAGFAEKFGRKG